MIRKLHIGAGKCYLPGFLNIDLFGSVKADAYFDMTNMPYEHGSFDVVYSSHCLEHCHRHMILATLGHWFSLLKPGGMIRVAVPNFDAVVARYMQTGDLPEVMGLLYGGQNYPRNVHTVTFNDRTLQEALEKVGFVDVGLYDWRKTEHASYDDFSAAYLPHLDKENGMLMSLNMQGRRP